MDFAKKSILAMSTSLFLEKSWKKCVKGREKFMRTWRDLFNGRVEVFGAESLNLSSAKKLPGEEEDGLEDGLDDFGDLESRLGDFDEPTNLEVSDLIIPSFELFAPLMLSLLETEDFAHFICRRRMQEVQP